MPEAIDLSEATLAVGTGTTVLGLDDTLLTLLLAQAPSLMPTSEAPNVALSAPHIVLGNVALDGDYVFLQTSLLETSGAFSTPTHDISERSEEHTSQLQSLIRTSYAVFCFKKKTT